jgi:hypothetical protein
VDTRIGFERMPRDFEHLLVLGSMEIYALGGPSTRFTADELGHHLRGRRSEQV